MKTLNPLTIGVAVITHNARRHLPFCLPPLLNSPLKPRVLVVNSSSQDGTVEEAQKMGAESLVVPRKSFNHGATREAARTYLGTDIVVMVTPDAYALDEHQLGRLIEPLANGQASATYGRQIPHQGAGFFEAFHRAFNYPAQSHIRGIEDLPNYGVYTFFCSDSFAAYLNKDLDSIGGFEPVLIGEDTVAVAKLLRKGRKVAYVSDAIVRHSHTYTLKQEFQRHFDTGLARKDYGHLFGAGFKDSDRGKLYIKTLFKKLWKEKPWLIPYAAMQTLAKWAGYHLGRASHRAPRWFKKRFSAQDFYWTSKGQ
jgi:rhamnosyltransferase